MSQPRITAHDLLRIEPVVIFRAGPAGVEAVAVAGGYIGLYRDAKYRPCASTGWPTTQQGMSRDAANTAVATGKARSLKVAA